MFEALSLYTAHHHNHNHNHSDSGTPRTQPVDHPLSAATLESPRAQQMVQRPGTNDHANTIQALCRGSECLSGSDESAGHGASGWPTDGDDVLSEELPALKRDCLSIKSRITHICARLRGPHGCEVMADVLGNRPVVDEMIQLLAHGAGDLSALRQKSCTTAVTSECHPGFQCGVNVTNSHVPEENEPTLVVGTPNKHPLQVGELSARRETSEPDYPSTTNTHPICESAVGTPGHCGGKVKRIVNCIEIHLHDSEGALAREAQTEVMARGRKRRRLQEARGEE